MASNNAEIRQALAEMMQRTQPRGGGSLGDYDMGPPVQGDPTATYSSYAQPTAIGAPSGSERELLRLLLQYLRNRRRPGARALPEAE